MKQNIQTIIESLESRTLMSATPMHNLGEAHEPTPTPGIVKPAKATDLAGTVDGTHVHLTWTDNATNELGYVIFRASGKSGKLTLIGAVTADATSYTDNTATDAADAYIVKAYNSAGNSLASNTISVQIPSLVQVIAPKTLRTKALSTTSIQVSWDRDYGATSGYRIERSLNGSDWTTAGTTGAGVKTFNDTGLTLGTRYYYRVVALGPVGHTATSNVLLGMTKLRDQGEHVEPTHH